jgi:hypothetical protein
MTTAERRAEDIEHCTWCGLSRMLHEAAGILRELLPMQKCGDCIATRVRGKDFVDADCVVGKIVQQNEVPTVAKRALGERGRKEEREREG